MNSREYLCEIFVQFSPSGVASLHASTAQETLDDSGKVVYRKVSPRPVSTIADNPALVALMGQANTQALATIDALTQARDSAITAKSQAESERDAAKATAAQLQAQITQLQGGEINGVPQVISFRQGKTFMQLYPVNGSDLWTVANAAADAISDATERVKTQNLLRDSSVYERQKAELIAFAHSLGLDDTTLDVMFTHAKQL